ncbi:MAG: hypothetical protein IPP81_08935 [Chitinophagaceae bacterium]|nr:hypothetical protein [Chitinophagaceae bacterium]
MNFKNITLPLMALALTCTIASCDGEKNEKDEKMKPLKKSAEIKCA